VIDLRSDTVTRPTPPMRRAMAEAEVGDDVFGDDPTVNRLEELAAEKLGKDAAVFVPSGTQSNLCALLAHCQRGDEYIVGEHAHTYMYEAGGGAVLGSIQPQPVRVGSDGMLDLDHVDEVVKPDDSHFARSRLLCLENTHDGKVLSLEQQDAGRRTADRHGLAYHLDGARLWNAAVALGVSPHDVAAPFDTVSVCLSKGLGAPIGSVLVGSAALIRSARRWRKALGGGMRQVGVVAAAGLYVLDHHIDRLAEDHRNAARLAEGLGAIEGITIDSCDTNMVFLHLDRPYPGLTDRLLESDISTRWWVVSDRDGERTHSRMVTHYDVADDDIDKTVDAVTSAVL
jgi:threonine aldolase